MRKGNEVNEPMINEPNKQRKFQENEDFVKENRYEIKEVRNQILQKFFKMQNMNREKWKKLKHWMK